MKFSGGKFGGWLSDARFRYLLRVQRYFPISRRYSYPFLRPVRRDVPTAPRSAHARDSAVPHKWTIKFYQSCCQFQNVGCYSSRSHTNSRDCKSATNASSVCCIICLDVSSHTLHPCILRALYERSSFSFFSSFPSVFFPQRENITRPRFYSPFVYKKLHVLFIKAIFDYRYVSNQTVHVHWVDGRKVNTRV